MANTTTITEVPSVALGALASRTAVAVIGPNMTQAGALISTTHAAVVLDQDSADGPFLYGIASRSLSVTEIKEYLEIGGPTFSSENIGQEQSTRGKRIRVLDVIGANEGNQGADTPSYVFKKNLSLSGLAWTIQDAGWLWWIYNLGALLVAGSVFEVTAQNFVRWE